MQLLGLCESEYIFSEEREKYYLTFLPNGYISYITLRPKRCNMSHITYEQRYTISCMLNQGKNRTEISKTIGNS